MHPPGAAAVQHLVPCCSRVAGGVIRRSHKSVANCGPSLGCHWHFRLAHVETSVDGRRTRVVAILETRRIRMQMTPTSFRCTSSSARSTWPTRSPSALLFTFAFAYSAIDLHGDNLWPLGVNVLSRGKSWNEAPGGTSIDDFCWLLTRRMAAGRNSPNVSAFVCSVGR